MKRWTPVYSHGTAYEMTDGEFVLFEDAQAEIAIFMTSNSELTREVLQLRNDLIAINTEFETVRAERVQLETLAASRADEIHRINNLLTQALLERDAWKHKAESK